MRLLPIFVGLVRSDRLFEVVAGLFEVKECNVVSSKNVSSPYVHYVVEGDGLTLRPCI